MAVEKNDLYKKLLNEMTERDLSNEVKETLDELRKMGMKLVIGSSSKNAKIILSRIGLDNYFDAISDGNNITKSKPDPEVFVKAAEFVKVTPKESIVVEDAESGIDAAMAAGAIPIGIGTASKYEKTAYSIQSFSELIEIVKKLNQ